MSTAPRYRFAVGALGTLSIAVAAARRLGWVEKPDSHNCEANRRHDCLRHYQPPCLVRDKGVRDKSKEEKASDFKKAILDLRSLQAFQLS